MLQPLWKTVWRVLKKLKLFNPAIPLLGTYPKELKTRTQTDICPSVFIAAIFRVAKGKGGSDPDVRR